MWFRIDPDPRAQRGTWRRLAADRSGNTLALVAGAMLPLLALVGSGVDMGRAYVVETRLQQACDAGVLAARKRLGNAVVVTGAVPSNVSSTGHRFFDLNFRDGSYATYDRQFQMTLEVDYAISGDAEVVLPMAVMQVFGQDEIPVRVSCQSKLNYTNLDIMMALDVTGSMANINPGDTLSRIDSLKQVIRNFHGQIEGAKAPSTRTRYGFVPYAANVNVGHLLQDDWVVNNWSYQSREDTGVRIPTVDRTYYRAWAFVSGTRSPWTLESTYSATWNTPPNADQSGWYSCNGSQPGGNWTYSDTLGAERMEVQTSPTAVLYITEGTRTYNGTRYRTTRDGTTCKVEASTDTNYVETFEKVREVPSIDKIQWRYKPISRDVTNWRSETNGCIEERKSTKLTDFSSVDLTQNLDLDINTVPTAGNSDTQWRPRYPGIIYARKKMSNGSGSFAKNQAVTTDDYVMPGTMWFSGCPARAARLAPMDATALGDYLATLSPAGATYHDIGMIWAGRLLSQNGLFAAANTDVSVSQPTSRHLIFLTDGATEPYDLSYGAYGVEPIDDRRWSESSTMTLTETIERRFLFACNEVKKNNTTVWIIAFGTVANQRMRDCAGAGRYFEASDTSQLQDAFNTIARSMGDLRISR